MFNRYGVANIFTRLGAERDNQTVSTPVETISIPVETVFTRVKFIYTPVNIVFTTVEAIATPVKVISTPVETVFTPVKAIKTHVETISTPIKMIFTPVETVSTAVEISGMVKETPSTVKEKTNYHEKIGRYVLIKWTIVRSAPATGAVSSALVGNIGVGVFPQGVRREAEHGMQDARAPRTPHDVGADVRRLISNSECGIKIVRLVTSSPTKLWRSAAGPAAAMS